MKKYILTIGLIVLLSFSLFAGGSGQFRLDKKTDIILLTSAGGSIATGMQLKSFANEPSFSPEGWTAWPSFHYNQGLSDTGNYLLIAGMLGLPFLMDQWDWINAGTLGVMYVEAMALSWGMKESLKAVFTKYRPYTLYSDTPAALMLSDDRFFSFPSGHTTVAFTTAGFATTVFSASEASLWEKYLFGGVSFSIAAGVAALRVTSGNHYLVDVIGGALLGTVSGVLVPLFHRINKNENLSMGLGLSSMTLDYSY